MKRFLNIEKLKTVILVILIANSFFLFGLVLLMNVLAYDRSVGLADAFGNIFFSYSTPDLTSEDLERSYLNSDSSIFLPSKVLALQEKSYGSVAITSEELAQAADSLRKGLGKTLTKESIVKIDEITQQAWSEVVEKNHIFADYGTTLPTEAFFEYLGVDEQLLNKSDGFRYIAVLPIDKDIISVCFKNPGKTGALIVCSGSTEGYEQMIQSLSIKEAESGYMPAAMARQMKIIPSNYLKNIPPETILPIEQIQSKTLIVENPIYAYKSDSSKYDQRVKSVLEAFDCALSSIRQHKSGDGSIMHVENYSTLSLSVDGVIHYSVSKDNEGIAISELTGRESGPLTLFDLITGGYNLLSKIPKDMLGGDEGTVSFGGLQYFGNGDYYRLYYKYVCDGYTINCNTSATYKGYPIVIDIKQGYIVGASLYSRSYRANGEKAEQLNLDNIITVFEAGGGNADKINRLGLCYSDNGEKISSVNAVWKIDD